MRALERLLCNCMWVAWVALLAGGRSARPGERPMSRGSSGEACRSLIPDRTVLPGW